MKEIKRSDKQYVEVEEFADYELTQCIVYEMAIRTREIQNLIKQINTYLIENEKAVAMSLICMLDKKTTIRDRENLENIYSSLLDFCQQIPVISLADKFIDKRLGEPLLLFIKTLRHIKNETINSDDSKSYLFKNNSQLGKIGLKSCLREKTNKRNGYSIIHKAEGISPVNQGFAISLARQDSYIELNFSRPLISLIDCHTLDTKLFVNLNRPKNELLALVEHIKNDFDRNKLLASPMELLGVEVNKANELMYDGTGKPFNPRDTLTTQEKIADMFYVYDSYQKGLRHGDKQKIEIEISKYYQEAKNKEVKFVDKTRTKYYEIAKEYIEYNKYRELVTGVSFS